MWEIFQALIEARGMTMTEVARATGINQATLSTWKRRGTMLSAKNAQIIADFLGVSVDYLMGRGDGAPEGYYTDPLTAEVAEELRTNTELRLLFDASKDATPEQLRAAHAVILALKRQEEHRDE